ncbi:Pericentriolar material 1 protein [Papilio xuthus]|uniref:Pericentriolar material 1 protein n=1 Tax=Papilio xuthus TaxID=66420 RepID=A0A194Q8U9_PAPXU|nr:Pericentriolar material 1 protein [Papilio xuthus]
MAPGNKDRHPGHTGTIPKTKARNNCNVPQEAVTPTRRDMTTNLVTTSLDWVPVSEYNTRSNFNQSRKPTNNTSDQELTDLDNSVSFESGFGRFVPVRPQPRILPLTVQNRENITSDHNDDGAGSSISSHTIHHFQNGLIPHSNHGAAAVMIVNPTTPNAVTGNMSQPFNPPNQNRNNLTRNLNSTRNSFDGNIHASNNNITPPISNSRTGTKTVNLMNNMYDQGQGSFNNINENNPNHRESARALGEAIVAACPDAAAVERRLGQIREYIRVTSSLVDTMRNSEDEAYIEHTKEEYDELLQMITKLRDSEKKLKSILDDEQSPDNIEVPILELGSVNPAEDTEVSEKVSDDTSNVTQNLDQSSSKSNNENNSISTNLKKVTNIENEQLNKTTQKTNEIQHAENNTNGVVIKEIETKAFGEADTINNDQKRNDELRKNIISCVEKVAMIEEIKNKVNDFGNNNDQDVVVRPVSVQSNGSTYSENELWQNEIKNKMEMSQIRLSALKQQQKRLLKYQAEAKQQLEELKERQAQEINQPTANDNFAGIQQNMVFSGNYNQPNRLFGSNQLGVATTLPQSSDSIHSGQLSNNMETEHGRSNQSTHSQDERFSIRDGNIASSEEAGGGGRDSDAEEDEGTLHERGRILQLKLRELQLKKQHMENLVSEFQKLQMATGLVGSHNTYSSSGEDSAEDEPSGKCNNAAGNLKKENKRIGGKLTSSLHKAKDLMRSLEAFETDHLSNLHDESFPMSNNANIHDNKSDGGGSLGHEANLASLQELAQELRMETEKIMGERARIKDMVSNKEVSRKQKKVNEEVRAGPSCVPGPAERRQMQLRALLADKQRELEALLNKEKVLCVGTEPQNKPDSRAMSVVNQSYNSEQEEPESRSEQLPLDSQTSRENENYRGGGDSAIGSRSINIVPSRLESAYGSDTDSRLRVIKKSGLDRQMDGLQSDPIRVPFFPMSASRNKSNQRNRPRRRQTQDRQSEDNTPQINNATPNVRHEPRPEASNVNMVSPVAPNGDNPTNMPYGPIPPQCWNGTKTNQDSRTNQFTQNSHSQTMERLLGTPQMSFPPAMPYSMMMPYGMVGGCGCGCGLWGAWCWQQLVMQQREIHQLREQLNHLEERWRAETASHTLNNQVPPGNRANNYWDNFRSYSRQNLLSANSKTNADGHLGTGSAHNPHPLVERSHNTLHHTSSSTSPSITPKRNTNTASSSQGPVAAPVAQVNNDEASNRHSRRNVTYERSLSFSSAPDVLNVNQNSEAEASVPSHSRNVDEATASNLNINRQETATTFRNLNITNPIPEIIQSHSNNLNNSTNAKKKSSSKLPSKNSTNRRNCTLDFSQTSNINITSTTDTPNPNLASTSREVQEKATSKLFDLLRENVYSEVTTLIGVNESHPDFLIQLFRELQLISSDPLRQKVLQSIRNVLAQYSSLMESENNDRVECSESEVVTTSGDTGNYHECSSHSIDNACANTMQIDNKIVRFLLMKSEEICTPELLEALASLILTSAPDSKQSKKRLQELLSKYEGMRVCDISSDIIENLSLFISGSSDGDESAHLTSEISETSILQDVAGSLNLFSSSETQLHQLNGCPYEMWPGHVHMDIDGADLNDNGARCSQEDKVDLINCSEMHNGDLAEADQTCHADMGDSGVNSHDEVSNNAEGLPDVVDTDEVTPTEAEAEWLGLDRVPTRLHMEDTSEKQKGDINI